MFLHQNDKGMTLVEQLVIIALVGIYFSIAFAYAGTGLGAVVVRAQNDADAQTTQAVANFVHQYENFSLTQEGQSIVARTDSGIEVARITGTL
jgi:Tfp pilus assembly protein PilE